MGIVSLHGPLLTLRVPAFRIGRVVLRFGLVGGRRRGGWRSGFLASFGFALLLRLSRCFELGFGQSLRLRLQFGLGLTDALSAPLLVGDTIRQLLAGLVDTVPLILLVIGRFSHRTPFRDLGFHLRGPYA